MGTVVDLGLVNLADIAPNHPFAHTQIGFGLKRPPVSKPRSESPKELDGVEPSTAPHEVTDQAATISVEWGYELHSLTLTPEQWATILGGEELGVKGAGYWYEGTFFDDYWHFTGGLDGDLIVFYGDDGGTGWNGPLRGATIEEHSPG